MKILVSLNGTEENPYAAWGLKQDPFPQLGKAEYDRHCLHLQKLGGDPIPNVDYIRRHLHGWSQEFVELCCREFRPGEYTVLEVEFPE